MEESCCVIRMSSIRRGRLFRRHKRVGNCFLGLCLEEGKEGAEAKAEAEAGAGAELDAPADASEGAEAGAIREAELEDAFHHAGATLPI